MCVCVRDNCNHSLWFEDMCQVVHGETIKHQSVSSCAGLRDAFTRSSACLPPFCAHNGATLYLPQRSPLHNDRGRSHTPPAVIDRGPINVLSAPPSGQPHSHARVRGRFNTRVPGNLGGANTFSQTLPLPLYFPTSNLVQIGWNLSI